MSTALRPIQAVVAGHLCLDLIPAFVEKDGHQIKDLLIPGKLINMGGVTVSTGGAVSNTGISLQLLGLETRLMGKIGDDFIGSGVQRVLQQHDAADGLIIDPTAETSYSIVIAPPGIDRIFLHNPGANDSFCAADLNLDLIGQSRLFHFGYPPLMRLMYENDGEELVRIYQKVRELGTTTSLDLALPDPVSPAGRADWTRILTRVLPLTDICLPSVEELLYMLDRPLFNQVKAAAGEQEILDYIDPAVLPRLGGQMIDLGAKIVVIKLGRLGYYVQTASASALTGIGPASPANPANWGGRQLWSGIYSVSKVASTSGAGDASIAGFLAGLLSGQTIETSTNLACAVAALKIQVKTSVGGILPLPEVLNRMPEWQKVPLTLDQACWRYSEADKLWNGI